MVVEDLNGTNIRFKCDDCGHFIPIADILSNAATHRIVTEETLYSRESYETKCKHCN